MVKYIIILIKVLQQSAILLNTERIKARHVICHMYAKHALPSLSHVIWNFDTNNQKTVRQPKTVYNPKKNYSTTKNSPQLKKNGSTTKTIQQPKTVHNLKITVQQPKIVHNSKKRSNN